MDVHTSQDKSQPGTPSLDRSDESRGFSPGLLSLGHGDKDELLSVEDKPLINSENNLEPKKEGLETSDMEMKPNLLDLVRRARFLGVCVGQWE